MRLIDADALSEMMYHKAFETDSDMQKWDSGCWIRYKMFENCIDVQPTIDAVPKEMHDEDCENAYAHGYTDSERNFRKMIEDGELVEVVRCKDCKHYTWADNRAFGFPVKRCEWTGFEDVDDDDFCSRGERRTDEQT